VGGAEQAHLHGAGLEEDDGRERVGERAEVIAEEVDAHPQPELEEVGLTPEARRRTFLRRIRFLALDLHVHGRLYARALSRVPGAALFSALPARVLEWPGFPDFDSTSGSDFK
jgi:hypothetical protein